MRLSTILVLLVSAALPAISAAPIQSQNYASIDAQTSLAGLVSAGHADRVVDKPLQLYPDIVVDIGSRNNPDEGQITFADTAGTALDSLHVNGDERSQILKYHEHIVKQDMAKHGAHHAVIHHLEHAGGSDPFETHHITANYYSKDGTLIKSPHSEKLEKEPGVKTKGRFHVRAGEQPHNPSMPEIWAKVLKADEKRVLAKQKAATEHAARLKADKAKKEVRLDAAKKKAELREAQQRARANAVRAQRELERQHRG